MEKSRRMKVAIKIFLNTVFALLISFITFYPTCIFYTESYRISEADEVVSRVNNIAFKLLHILTSPILIFYTIQVVKNYKNDKKATKIIIALMILLLLPIVVEPFNRLWHTGSYSGMPYRFAFILIFVAVCGMLRYFQTAKPKPKKEQNARGVKIVKAIIVLFMISNLVFNIYAIKAAWEYQYIVGEVNNDEQLQYYSNVAISVIVGVLTLICTNEIQEEKFRKSVLIGVFIINTIFLMFLYIKNFECFGMIDDENSVYLSQKLYEDFYEGDSEYKVKDDTELLLYNYPYIMKMNSIQNWFHTIPKRQVLAIQKWGYANNSVIQKDVGGTLISDAIIGVNRIIAKEEKDEEVYKELKSRNAIKYYTYNFKELPLCKVYSNEDFSKVTNYLEEDFEVKDVFGVQNELYKIFFNRTEEHIIQVQTDRKEEKINKKDERYCVTEDSKITYEVNLNSKSNLYLYSYDLEDYVLLIQIYKDNERKEKIYENKLPYPDELHNGILDLGIYDAQKLYMDIIFVYDDRDDKLSSGNYKNKEKQNRDNDEESDREGSFEEIELGVLDIEQFLKTINENEFINSDLKMEGHAFKIIVEKAEENQYLMIPINYDDDWTAKINGKEAEILPALGTYMTVKLENGANEIEFEFFPKDLKIGVEVTVVSSVLYLIVLIVCKKTGVKF